MLIIFDLSVTLYLSDPGIYMILPVYGFAGCFMDENDVG
jgi:hypothetical protein